MSNLEPIVQMLYMKVDMKMLEKIAQWFLVLAAWARPSAWSRLLVLFLIVSMLCGAAIGGIEWLLWRQRTEGKGWRLGLELTSKELLLQFSADRITNCIKARNENQTLRAWYCDLAVQEYRKATEGMLTQAYVDDIVRRRAFLEMQAQIAHNIRSIELNRKMEARNWEHDEQIRFALSWKGFGMWAAVAFGVLCVVAYFLWGPEQRRQDRIRKAKAGVQKAASAPPITWRNRGKLK